MRDLGALSNPNNSNSPTNFFITVDDATPRCVIGSQKFSFVIQPL
jgi:hypothetical protein